MPGLTKFFHSHHMYMGSKWSKSFHGMSIFWFVCCDSFVTDKTLIELYQCEWQNMPGM